MKLKKLTKKISMVNGVVTFGLGEKTLTVDEVMYCVGDDIKKKDVGDTVWGKLKDMKLI